ncbi:hypothetical protein ACQEU8_00460 [Streptomyces sp. CA-250714]|uniref:hypothetical protein n=1 Tax=Streptomyces sp. CA-250714 TaxID=3240060 RepID=UPI003D8AB5D1
MRAFLEVVGFLEEAVAVAQFIVGPGLNDAAVVQDEDAVGDGSVGETVGGTSGAVSNPVLTRKPAPDANEWHHVLWERAVCGGLVTEVDECRGRA